MSKNIIICCDGTGNEFGCNNTNVVKLYQMATKENGQIAYYDPGVGTGSWDYDESVGDWRAKSDSATGNGLQKNVEDAYQYLMHYYENGDRIYLFGFSRGAFTVRSLAGMLYKCGLLYSKMHNMVEYASKIYNTKKNPVIAKEFKETMARQCPVHFIGVWDTVKSLALNAGKKFHDAKLNPEVSHGYHAVALDEIRKNFPPSLWNKRNNVEQVWFAGVHSDVGGWYGDSGLSDIALKWMATKALNNGMLLNEEKLATITGNPLAMQHDSHSGFFWNMMGTDIRTLPADSKVHESVRARLDEEIQIGNDEDEEKTLKNYRPEANNFSADEIQWVSD